MFLQMPDMIFDGVDFSTANASLVASMPGQCWDSRYNQTQSQTCSVSCRSYGKASIHYPNELGTVAET